MTRVPCDQPLASSRRREELQTAQSETLQLLRLAQRVLCSEDTFEGGDSSGLPR